MSRTTMIRRRNLVLAMGTTLLAAAMPSWARTTKEALKNMQDNWHQYLAEAVDPPSPTDKVTLDAAAWRERLDRVAYDVLRDEGTERPFSSSLNDEKRAGVYLCAGCDLPLFTSEMKFDSGTGWPSFFTSIPGHVDTKRDFKLVWPRTEYHCTRCGGHQGHVFNDGPAPTGERWCNNGVALRFVPRDSD